MTEVLPCYSLCPLIEQKSFLGISPDADPDTVIVTTNSNIIGRYRLSDPKEISSWNSKGSISCSTVYDSTSRQYVTIFNRSEIRKWAAADKSIDKVKKYKFTEKLYGLSISPENNQLLIIFEKGYVRYLNKAIESRKSMFSTSFIRDKDKILECKILLLSNQLITVILVKDSENCCRLLGVPVDESSIIFNLAIEKQSSTLCSHCIIADKNVYFVSLWSDGKMYRDCIYPNAVTVPSNDIVVLDDIDLEQPVMMKALSSYTVAICGSKDEGLLLMIYSMKYNSVQCKQFYENCTNSPQLWNINSNLFLIMGHNLVVIPFVQENRKLSTLIGCNHQHDASDTSVLSLSEICSNYSSKLLENDEEEKIQEMLTLYYDIPDETLLNIIMWSLDDIESRKGILNIVLNDYCSNLNDVSKVRSLCSVDQSLCILEHIMNIITCNENNFTLLKWATLFIDAFYQQYIMSDDKSIVDKLNKYLRTVTEEKSHVNEFMQLASVMSCVQRKKVILSM